MTHDSLKHEHDRQRWRGLSYDGKEQRWRSRSELTPAVQVEALEIAVRIGAARHVSADLERIRNEYRAYGFTDKSQAEHRQAQLMRKRAWLPLGPSEERVKINHELYAIDAFLNGLL